MTSRHRLGVIFGGLSVEHEVSVHSAQHVIASADRERFELVPLGVAKDGAWLTPAETQAQLDRPDAPFKKTLRHEPGTGNREPGAGLASRLAAALEVLQTVDVVFPLIHGAYGEDGALQGALEIAGLPYVGCGVAASAIGMDKGLMKALFREAGIPVAEHVVLRAPAGEGALLASARELEERLALPLFVKPANGGSSVGVSKASSREEIALALAEAARFDRRVVVEEAIAGREVECGLLGNEDAEASPVGEVKHGHEFYDYEAKYLDPATENIVPADITAETAARLQDLARRAFHAIDGAGMSRVDFFLKADGSLIIDEINTLPGFSPGSMFPRLWAAAGVNYSQLITRLVGLALARHREKRLA